MTLSQFLGKVAFKNTTSTPCNHANVAADLFYLWQSTNETPGNLGSCMICNSFWYELSVWVVGTGMHSDNCYFWLTLFRSGNDKSARILKEDQQSTHSQLMDRAGKLTKAKQQQNLKTFQTPFNDDLQELLGPPGRVSFPRLSKKNWATISNCLRQGRQNSQVHDNSTTWKTCQIPLQSWVIKVRKNLSPRLSKAGSFSFTFNHWIDN